MIPQRSLEKRLALALAGNLEHLLEPEKQKGKTRMKESSQDVTTVQLPGSCTGYNWDNLGATCMAAMDENSRDKRGNKQMNKPMGRWNNYTVSNKLSTKCSLLSKKKRAT